MGEPARKLEFSAPAPAAGKVLDTTSAPKAFSLPVILKTIQVRHGKPLHAVVTEMAKLAFSSSKISTEDYLMLRLFDDQHLSYADKLKFAGVKCYHKIWAAGNANRTFIGVMNDKVVFDALFKAYGLPVIETKAFYSAGFVPPAFKHLRSADQIRAFLNETANYPFFSKPRKSLMSLGSASVDGYDAGTDELLLQSGKRVPAQKFIDEIVTHYQDGYLFQNRVSPHDEVKALCGDKLATVRVYTLNGPRGPEVFRTIWKIPSGKNSADNFWRKGNMLAALDIETGAITRVISGTSIDQVEPDVHPDSGQTLVGTVVPNYAKVLQAALDGAKALPEIRVIGWDIAPTNDGAVIVEGNHNPDFRLVQMAERRGILDSRMAEFMSFCEASKAAETQSMRREIKSVNRAKLQTLKANSKV